MLLVVLIASILLIGYAYAGYFALAYLIALVRTRPVNRQDAHPQPSVSVVVAARNERVAIGRRIENLLAQEYELRKLEIVVVSDGSSDGTEAIVGEFLRSYGREDSRPRLRLISHAPSRGKPAAINAAVAVARGEIIVFADCRQEFSRNAIGVLASNFSDPNVGCVSGELVFRESGVEEGVQGIGMYWSAEKWLRKLESRSGSVPGATGAIYALRRSLFWPIPEETLLDDVLVPMQVVRAGYRVVFDERALAFDTMSKDEHQERRRKIRTLAGNWQLLIMHPWLLNPLENPLWLRFLSHKILRLLVPYAGLSAVASAVALDAGTAGPVLVAAAAGACAGWVAPALTRNPAINKFSSLVKTVVLLNYAALVAPFKLLRPRSELW